MSKKRTSIHPIDIRLLEEQIDLILRSLELYAYNLEYMLDENNGTNTERQNKLAMLKYTYDMILSNKAENASSQGTNNSKNITEISKKLKKDTNLINLIPDKENINII